MGRKLPADFERQWRTRFERFARDGGGEAAVAGWTESGLSTRVDAFATRFPAAAGSWLDAGCGAGTYVNVLHERGAAYVVGLDYSRPSLKRAREFVAHPQSGWLAGDVRALPFPDGCFDGVLCFGVTQTLRASDGLLEELVRVVRPGGEIWMDGLNDRCLADRAARLWARARGGVPRLRLERAVRLADGLRSLGCRDLETHWVPVIPARWPRWARWVMTRAGGGPLQPWLSHSFLIRAFRAGEVPQQGG
ncbi:class I SAM-dependent methyltransferase [Arhodomonas sp. SL1]|uniref:class I SAM-dependent methyltransferase n=1 Tax=Arhodomonas sp. SL1 TaxID=3425691 RepID=UPI003F88216C